MRSSLVLFMQPDDPVFPDAPFPAPVAHGDVAVVTAQQHLGALCNDMAVAVDPGVGGGLRATVADGLDLLDGVRHLQKAQASREQLGLKIRPQTKADHRNIQLVDDGAQLADLLRGEELALIGDDHIAASLFLPAEALIDVRIRGHHIHPGLQADAAAQSLLPVPDISAGLDEPYLQAVFLVVVLGDQRLCGLAGAHCSVFEVKLRHTETPLPNLIPLYPKRPISARAE